MNHAQKIESVSYPRYRRKGDRVAALSQIISQVERAHATRLRRMTLIMAGAVSILLFNTILIATLA